MRPAVAEQWLTFTEPMEGGVLCWYNDVRGLTTIAFGDLCNTPSEAASLPMVHPDGTFANTAEKIAAWRAVHDDPHAAAGGWRYAAKLTDLRLTREGMRGLALAKLATNDRILLARLPAWEDYNACVQMAMHSWAWACGPNGHWPRLFQAVTDRDFDRAAVEIHINEWTPEGVHNVGLFPRNDANKLLMRNAQLVDAYHLDPNTIEWAAVIGVHDLDTVPAIDVAPDCEPTTTATFPTIHRLRYDRGPDDPPDEAA